MNDTANSVFPSSLSGWRLKCYTIIFEADTVMGKRFDLVLLWSIVISLIVIMIDSMQDIHAEFKEILGVVEWFFTILFTLEYVARLHSTL